MELKPPHTAAEKVSRGMGMVIGAPPASRHSDRDSSDGLRPKLFVGQLGPETDERALTEVFSQFGDIESAVVMRHADTGRSKNCGFVNFYSVDACHAAVEALHQKHYMPGSRDAMTVKFAESPGEKMRRRASGPGPRRGGGGRGGEMDMLMPGGIMGGLMGDPVADAAAANGEHEGGEDPHRGHRGGSRY
jgi:cold-inducible RNA-binding protein